MPLEMAIKEVGLPAEMEVLREAFYKAHGGTNTCGKWAWNRAIEASDLVLKDGKLDRGEEEMRSRHIEAQKAQSAQCAWMGTLLQGTSGTQPYRGVPVVL